MIEIWKTFRKWFWDAPPVDRIGKYEYSDAHMDMITPKFMTYREWKKCQSDKK